MPDHRRRLAQCIQPFSAYLRQPAPAAPPAIDFPLINTELVKENFFDYLDFALQFSPAGPEEKEIRAKLLKIGVGPGKTFSFKDLSLEHKLEIGLGMKEGDKKVNEKIATVGKDVNGWRVAHPLAIGPFTTATGYCERLPHVVGYTATMPRKQRIP